METQFKIGDKVRISEKTNSWWAGYGEVCDLYQGSSDTCVGILMTSGKQHGMRGGFKKGTVELLTSVKAPMQIIKIKRSNQKTGLKVYGTVRGESGKVYNAAYIRRSNFRGWICSCENFFFTMFKKNRNCKHIKFVRSQVGRYGASV
jgi:hypothetical protein